MKRRWPVVLLAGVLLLISIAVAVTLISSRSVEGAVPGRAPLLGLAIADGRYLVASETGLYVSPDGKSWSKPAAFAGRPALVTGLHGQGAVVLSGDGLFRSVGPGRFEEFLPGKVTGAAISAAGGELYVAESPQSLKVISRDCLLAVAPEAECARTGLLAALRLSAGPDEILALDVVPAEPPVFFAGGLRSGVWRSSTPEQNWKQVLQTPTRAIMVDDRNSEQIFLGTAGGLLSSQDQGLSWSFTGMRQAVEALAQSGDGFFALTGDRLIYRSSDGQTWEPA